MSECVTLIQGTRLRATRVDDCGAPVGGDDAYVTTSGFVSVAMKDNVEAPVEFKIKNAAGEYCVNQRSKPLLNWIECTITLCQVAPELYEMLTGSRLVYDDAVTPNPIGFGTDTDVYATANFAMELWTNVDRANAACSGGSTRYGYLLLPWLVEGALGDLTIENGPVSFTINAITSGGNDWGVGPYDVMLDNASAPSPLLDPIPANRHRHLQLTSLAPPDAACGYQSLVLAS